MFYPSIIEKPPGLMPDFNQQEQPLNTVLILNFPDCSYSIYSKLLADIKFLYPVFIQACKYIC
ncbi:MAG TPA: hypothetical protein DCQ58_03220 [Saprospirales bacterium]|nr:hypothetical protein [Saprospirales bacterium]